MKYIDEHYLLVLVHPSYQSSTPLPTIKAPTLVPTETIYTQAKCDLRTYHEFFVESASLSLAC